MSTKARTASTIHRDEVEIDQLQLVEAKTNLDMSAGKWQGRAHVTANLSTPSDDLFWTIKYVITTSEDTSDASDSLFELEVVFKFLPITELEESRESAEAVLSLVWPHVRGVMNGLSALHGIDLQIPYALTRHRVSEVDTSEEEE